MTSLQFVPIPSFPRRRLTTKLMASAVFLSLAVIAAPPQAVAGPPPHKVSGIDPFASCTADQVASQPGTNYPDSEIEPYIDANPTSPANLIAGWQQDRWSDGGSRGLVAGASLDGGQTWSRIPVPRISKCSGGIYDRATDPWVSISPNGTAYFISLAFNNNRPDGGGGQNAVLVSRSTNGGYFWSRPYSLIVDTDGQIFNDKQSVTADPIDSRYAFAVWDRLIDFTLPSGRQSGDSAKPTKAKAHDGVANARLRHKMLSERASNATAAAVAPTFKGPTIFVRTTNGGVSWEPPKVIYDPGNDAQTIGNIVEVLPSGVLANFFTNITVDGATSIGIQKSANKGKTFAAAALPITTNVTFTGTISPDSHEPVRDGNILFDPAVDPQNGNLYLVWQDGRSGNIDKVFFSMSTNAGLTWSPPIRIAMTPPSTVKLRNQSFIPSVEVGANHQIVVTYYDFRNDQSDGRELVDYFAVFCTPSATVDCSKRANWGDGVNALRDIRISRNSFDILNAPVAGGHFLGDYMGLARRGAAVMPAFGMADSLNKTSIYTTPIRANTSISSAE